MHFASSTGLNEIIQVSRCDVGKFLEAALTALRTQMAAVELQPRAGPEGAASASSQIEEHARNGRRVAIACMAIGSAAILIGIAAYIRQPQPHTEPQTQATAAATKAATPPASPALETAAPSAPARLPVAVAAPSPPARSPVPIQPSPKPASAWVAKTTRAVRVKAEGQEILIPKGAQLRVVGRSASDVLVSYGGSTATIPASATDLR